MSYRSRVEAAERALRRIGDKVYDVKYPRRDVPFSECFAAAPPALQHQYREACATLAEREQAAIDSGKAWRDLSRSTLLHWR